MDKEENADEDNIRSKQGEDKEMDDKKMTNNDDCKALKVDELEVSGGTEISDWDNIDACPRCGYKNNYRTGKSKKGLFGLLTYYEYHCKDCGRDFWA